MFMRSTYFHVRFDVLHRSRIFRNIYFTVSQLEFVNVYTLVMETVRSGHILQLRDSLKTIGLTLNYLTRSDMNDITRNTLSRHSLFLKERHFFRISTTDM